MQVQDIVRLCAKNNIGLSVVGENIKVSGNKENLSPEIIHGLKTKKGELIDFISRFKQAGNDEPTFEKIPPLEHSRTTDLSYAQQRLWMLDKLSTSGAEYNLPMRFRLGGHFSEAACRKAIEAIVERHKVLRTVVVSEQTEVKAQVLENYTVPIIVHNLHGIAQQEQIAEVDKIIAADSDQRFDLSSDVLLRARIFSLSDIDHIIFINIHHIAADGWSLGVLYREFNQFYRAFSQGQPDTLNPLPIQYADYAHWQKKWLQGGVLERQLDYWKTQLKGLPELHGLPLDKPRPLQQSYEGAVLPQVIGEALLERMHAFCRREHITLFMFLHSALSVLFSRYSGEEDIVIGTPVAGRGHSEVEDLIGLFVNTLVLRSHTSAEASFNELVARNKSIVLSAFENQHLPFETLVENLKPQRSLDHSPLFQIMLTLHNNEKMRLDIDGVDVKENIYTRNAIKFDLEIMASEHEGKLYIDWTYCTDLFEQASIANLSIHLEALIAKVLDHEEAKLGSLDFLSEQEQDNLLAGVNQTRCELNELARLETLFENQAARVPHHIAVKSPSASLNYAELNAQASRLANYLCEQGIQAGDCVAVCMERGCDFIVAVLAILKAGACYLPCDPEYPRARLAAMLASANAKLLLVHSNTRIFNAKIGSLASTDANTEAEAFLQDLQCVDLEQLLTASWFENYASTNEAIAGVSKKQDLNAAAAIIFTSGSTGQPKGVVLTHNGLANRLLWMKSLYPAQATDVFCQKTSLNFVDHLAEIFQPLCEGVTSVVVPDKIVKDSEAFVGLISQERVSHLTLVPSVLQLLMQSRKFVAATDLKQIISSGETLPTSLAQQLLETMPQLRLLNLYGSSEVSADVLYKEVTLQDLNTGEVTLGQPIANNKVYLLDGRGKPVPIGVEAEIYVAGDGLAQAYLGASQEEQEKRFVSFPHVGAGERLFRSGDKGRRLASGDIQFTGRTDEQIKIRGLRIEAAEIQNHLVALEEISEALVATHTSESGVQQLLAYLTLSTTQEKNNLSNETEMNVRRLCRTALQKKLPVYMLPDIYIVLDALPRTSTGKISKRLLPPPGENDLVRHAYVAPRTEAETLLAHLWSDILNLPKVGVEDNFFELGGHSLLATKLVSRIRRELSTEISFKSLFEYPTVSALAEYIETHLPAHASLPTISARGSGDTRYPSHAQQRLWFLDKLGEANAEYNLPMQFRVSGQLNVDACNRAIHEVVRRHEVLRSVIASEQGCCVSRVLENYEVPIKFHDLSGLNEEARAFELEALLENDSNRSFDLGADVMLRAQIIRLTCEDHVLFFNVHHIAIDGWSMAILYREFNILYNAYKDGKASPLQDLAIQYADFAAWQNSWLSEARQHEQLDYWKHQLRDLPRVHALPLDKPRPAKQTFKGEVHYQDLGSELLQNIKAFCNKKQLTLYMFLQTAFSILLSRYSREQDIVMGTPVAGRKLAETENLIGLFVNTLVLRSHIAGEKVLEELLQDNKAMILAAMDHQDVPLEFLVDQLKPERSVSHSPLFQILFTLHNNSRHLVELDELTLTENISFRHKIKFDLELEAFELNKKLGVNWAFNTDLFECESIENLAENFRSLLQAMLDFPECTIAHLPLINAREQADLLVEQDGYHIQLSEDMRVERLFEQHAMLTPAAIAIKDGAQCLTYAELNVRANRLAAHIRSLGVTPESLVGVCLRRNVDLLVTMLAVFKSGGAYVPLDATYPAERLDYMLEDSQASLVITESSLFDACGNSRGNERESSLQTLHLDDPDLQAELQTYAGENPDLATRAKQAAYVIYTSGSTGKPKGVCVEHWALCNFLLSMAKTPGFTKSDKLLAVTSVSFDIAGLEMYLPLITGGSLYIANENEVKDSAALQALLVNEEITVMQATPSTWRLLLAGNWPGHAGLKVLCGGEAWPVSLNEQLQTRVGSVWNVYGPTETTIWSTVNKIEAGASNITLGRPIANTRIYILDDQYKLVPRGGIGELYIGGEGLAREYLHRAELTAERFLPNPFIAGERIYRTGDLARWRVDNSLQYLGRNDFQVKIRGYRVEVEEIEKNLLALDFVDNAVVSVCDQQNNAAFLAAYIVPDMTEMDIAQYRDDQPRWVERCKQHLAAQLPKYMVPECYVFLDAFPLTLNNKIDRKALPQINVAEQNGIEYEVPTSAEELAVCEAIQHALSLARVGVNDNFFALGGDSISAIKFLNVLREQGMDVSLQDVFQQTTNKALATKLYRYTPVEQLAAFCLLTDDERKNIEDAYEDIYPVSSSQAGLLLHSELHPDTYNNVFNFRVKAKWNEQAFQAALQSLVQEHPILRTRFDMHSGGRALQYVQREITLPLSVRHIEEHEYDRAQNIIREHLKLAAARQYDYTQAPLFAVKVFTIGDAQFEYCLSFHHVIMDGWSASLFTGALLERYQLLLSGKALPEMNTNWQFRRAIASELQAVNQRESEQYWRECLDRQPGRQLPVADNAGQEQSVVSCYNENFFALSHELVELARHYKVPAQAVFLAIHFRVLASWSGSSQVVSTIGVSARPESQGAESALGLFVNALPLTSEVAYDVSWEAFIKKLAADWALCTRHGKYPISQIGKMQTEILFNYTHFKTTHSKTTNYKTVDPTSTQGDLQIIDSHFHEKTNFDFHVSFYRQQHDDKVCMEVKYKDALYSAQTVNRILDSYCQVAASLLADPQALVGRARTLPSLDEQRFEAWNNTATDYAQHLCVHELVEQWAQQQADKVAVAFPDGELSYSELNTKANQLAHYLRRQGVHAEEFVAVLIEPSVNVVVSILAILKAGAAYLPIDISYPKQRIETLLSDSQARFVLHCGDMDIALPDAIRHISIGDDKTQSALATCGANNIPVSESGVSPQSLAYMIYTSGSTGTPKGVMIEHKNISSLVADREYVHIDQHSVIAQASSISFDAATFEIWGALSAGATLVHLEKDKLLDTDVFAKEIKQKAVDTLFITTALFNKIVFDKPDSFSSLKYLLFGGEQASYEAVNTAIKTNPATHILHVYGPTETTTFASYSRLYGAYSADRRLPIGKPMANTRFYVMSRGELLPQGVRGELFIGGTGTGRGYWQRQALSEEKFIADAFSGNGKLYATGDAVRWLPNGEIEFLGRQDRQVKIRGFRIELDEIEKVVNAHPAVDSCYIATQTREANTSIVCYFVAASEHFTEADVRKLRVSLKANLPDYMIPAAFVALSEFPLTTNGKINRAKLPEPSAEHYVGEVFIALSGIQEKKIGEAWTKVLGIAAPGANDNFFDVGGNSLLAVKLRNAIASAVGRTLSIADIFAYPTIASLAEFLSQTEQDNIEVDEQIDAEQFSGTFDIAIIGMAGRFPGATNIDEYWQNIRSGKEVLQQFSEEELLQAGVDAQWLNNKNYVKSGVVLENIDSFDAAFFGFTPREAEILDPQQRLLFECTQEVLEDGGYANTGKQQNVGTFISVADSRYLWEHINSQPELYDTLGGMTIRNANAKDAAATRLAYKFNFLGPSVNVNTACSSSLVAVHEACKSLWMGESCMAIAGGADIHLLKPQGYFYNEGDVLSADGACRAFDQQAGGTRIGSGCGLVLLKPLEKALQDRDHIHAVIKGSAINNDGARKVGYTAPSVSGQAECIRRAIGMAGVDAGSVGYVEAHGTGTIIGDPIEIEALTRAYGDKTRSERCAIGAVKPNIGHLNVAAGIAGLIKTVCVVKHKEIPPLINFSHLNSEINAGTTPFNFSTELRAWEQGEQARRAGVSSFGIGGTNSHVIVEEYCERQKPQEHSPMPPQLILLSAGSEQALGIARERLFQHLSKASALSIQDIAYTLQTGRKQGNKYLQAIVCESREELLHKLGPDAEQGKIIGASKLGAKAKLAFMFPGQGAQYPGMARGLYKGYPVFKEVLDSCAELALPYLKQNILDILGVTDEKDIEDASRAELLKATSISQPLIFSVEYALAKLLMSWGLQPETMIGHSLGEYVAACVAGVFSLEDGVKLVCKRGALMQAQAPGCMLAINANADQVLDIVTAQNCEIAAENSGEHCVASGSETAIRKLEAQLSEEGIKCSQLHTSHAFHSKLMEPVLPDFNKVLEEVSLHAPNMAYISNLDGQDIRTHDVTKAQYWLDHLRHSVKFHKGLQTILASGSNILLEVGPGTSLSTFARATGDVKNCKIVSSLRHPKIDREDTHYLLGSLAEMYQAGLEIDWNALHFNRACHRVSLPTYVFSRQRYWIDVRKPALFNDVSADTDTKGSTATVSGNVGEPSANCGVLVPEWKRKPLSLVSNKETTESTLYLLVGEHKKLLAGIAENLQQQGEAYIQVTFAKRFSRDKQGNYRLGSDLRADFEKLLRVCVSEGERSIKIIFVTSQSESRTAYEDFERIRTAQESSLYALIALANASSGIAEDCAVAPIECCLVTQAFYDVVGTEVQKFDHAPLVGAYRSINQECSHFKVRHIDLDGAERLEKSAANLLAELASEQHADAIAWRSGVRWVREYRWEQEARAETKLRVGGVYLISGGLGKIGLSLAHYLRKHYDAKVVLQTRTALNAINFVGLPAPDNIQVLHEHNILACHYQDAPSLYIANADPANLLDMQSIFEWAEAELGVINGVIHAAGQTQGVIKTLEAFTQEDAEKQFKPKIQGTLVLDKLLENRDVDFCMLMSSLSAVLGGIGYGVYAGVNTFMDMFSQSKARAGDSRWLSVNWDGWDFSEVSDANNDSSELTESHYLQACLRPEEGVEVFARCLQTSQRAQLVTCKGDFFSRYKNWVQNSGVSSGSHLRSHIVAAVGEVEKPDSDTIQTLSTQQRVQGIWEKLFGIDDIGPNDNFFEIGGDSLLLARLVANINAEFSAAVKVSIKDMFECPTIRKVAEFIELSLTLDAEDASRLDELCCEEGEL